MKNLKFKANNKNVLETDELTGNQAIYKAFIDELNFYGWILEITSEFSKSVYHIEKPNLNDIKKDLKKQLEMLGVKFEKQIRNKSNK